MPTDARARGEPQGFDLFREIPVGVLLTSAQGAILAANPAAQALLGEFPDAARSLDLTAAGHATPRAVRWWPRRDGSWATLEVRTHALGDGRLLSTVYDLTDRSEAISALLPLALDAEDLGVWALDPTGQVATLSPRCRALLGAPRSAARVDGWIDRVHPEDRADLVQAIQGALAPRGRLRHAFRVLHPDGRERWLWMLGGAASERGLRGIALDVSDRKASEQRLRADAEHLRAVCDAIPDLVWAGDPAGVPEYVNRAWIDYTGIRPADLTAARWRSLVHPADLDTLRDAWRRAHDAAGRVQCDIRVRRGDGAWRWFRVLAVPAADRTGQPIGWVGTLTDVDTERSALDALRAAARRKDDLLADLSHELRDPLAPILTGLRVLQGPAVGTEVTRHTLSVLTRQVRQLAQRLDDLLELTRIQRGEGRLHREAVDLVDLVARTVEDHRPAFAERALSLQLHPRDEAIPIMADGARLSQIVGNLLRHAARSEPPGGRVDVVLDARPDAATILVGDPKVGIAPARLGPEVEPDMPTETPRDGSGFGLGLALAEGLTELHGGRLTLHHASGDRGATFVVELPRGDAPEARPTPVTAGPKPPPARRILVIEDNRDGAESLRDALSFAGHEVHVAYDGDEGVRLAREVRPDVLLCDIGLPDIDGYEVARRIRADPALRGCLLVALTGHGLPADRRRANDVGFTHHLTKPTPLEVLEALLARPLTDD